MKVKLVFGNFKELRVFVKDHLCMEKIGSKVSHDNTVQVKKGLSDNADGLMIIMVENSDQRPTDDNNG